MKPESARTRLGDAPLYRVAVASVILVVANAAMQACDGNLAGVPSELGSSDPSIAFDAGQRADASVPQARPDAEIGPKGDETPAYDGGGESATGFQDADADAPPPACPLAVHSGTSAVSFQVDPQHTGAQPSDTLTLPLCQRWSHEFSGGNALLATPVMGNGLVYELVTSFSGAQAPGGQPAVYALDENTGKVIWGPVNIGGSSVSDVGGVTLDEGQLFALSGDGVIASIEPTSGAVVWHTQLTGQTDWQSSPVGSGGMIFANGYGIGNDTTYAVSEADGSVVWTSGVSTDVGPPTVTSDAIFLNGGYGAAFCIDRGDGGTVWSRPGAPPTYEYSPISVLDGELYVPNCAPYPAWTGAILDPATGSSNGPLDSFRTPAGSAGTGFFAPSNGTLLAVPLGATTVTWSAGSYVVTSPLVVGSNVVVGTSYGISVFSVADGGLVSTASLKWVGQGWGGGLQEADGVLVVGAQGVLYAY